MDDVRMNLNIIFFVCGSYFLNKFLLRPFVLKNDFGEILNIFVLSYPNFCEAIIGTLFITNVVLILNEKYLKKESRIKEEYLYFIAVALAAIYVILQEFKIHNLGGANVYDANDVIFSIIGLTLTSIFLLLKKPKYFEET